MDGYVCTGTATVQVELRISKDARNDRELLLDVGIVLLQNLVDTV